MSKEKILVVDDDVNICELLRLYIERDDYQVVIANDGEQAVELFNREQPDLVLLDIMLPKMDGWQVCKEIRKTSNRPIIMLTAKGELFDKILGLELGADDYIIKPFEAKEVIARIHAVLRRTSTSEEKEKVKEINWDKLKGKVSSIVSTMLGIVGNALLVVGAILAFSGVALPLGIGLMVAGAGSLLVGTAMKVDWKAIPNQIKKVMNRLLVVIYGLIFVKTIYHLIKKSLLSIITKKLFMML